MQPLWWLLQEQAPSQAQCPTQSHMLPGTQLQMQTAPGGIGEPHGRV
jgi:hypothetical protein